MANRTAMEPKTTIDLIDSVYEAEMVDEMRRDPSPMPQRCPPSMRFVLRLVDSMIRQRLLEHTERNTLGQGRPGKKKGKGC